MPKTRTRYLDKFAAEQFVLRALRDRHGEDAVLHRPLVSPTTGETLRSVVVDEPADYLAGLVAAHQLASIATALAVGYASKARGAGRSWLEIATTLRLEVEHPAEAAFALFSEQIRLHQPEIRWVCGSCGERITDCGPYGGHPDDFEFGHASRCSRHAADIRAYQAGFVADRDEHEDDRP